VRVGSSPDNDKTGWYYQTARAWLARQRGVTKVNQWLNPLKCGTSSNLVDMGWAAVRVSRVLGETTPKPWFEGGGEAKGKCLWRTFGEAAAAKLGVDPVDRCEVNVGTVSVLPSPASSPLVGGQVHCRLLMPERDGGFVVVRTRESRVHGEGTQQVSGEVVGMLGGRR
jgi:hypothetical protein